MFTIEELEQMKQYTVLDFVYKIDEIMDKLEPRAEKSMHKNVAASRDARKYLRQIKFICDVTRDKISVDNFDGTRKRDLIQDEIDNENQKRGNAIKRHEAQLENIRKARNGKKNNKE